MFEKLRCNNCNSLNKKKSGREKSGIQRFACIDCGKKFNENTGVYAEGDSLEENDKLSFSQEGNTAVGTIITAIKPDDMIEAVKKFKVNLKIWEPYKMDINDWDVNAKNKNHDGFIKASNYQVKVHFRIREQKLNPEEWAELFLKKTKNYIQPKLPKITYTKSKSNYMLEISIADLHFGKLAWHGESGENYDIKIAAKRFMDSIIDLVNKSAYYKPKKIWFIIGNDFFNADNIENTTTLGTPQDCDVRWEKRFDKGCDLILDGIEILRQIAPVQVIVIPGNHDKQTSFFMGKFIDGWYHSTKHVVIDNSAFERKYHMWGVSLLGFTHGEKIKYQDLPLIMATEAKEYWAKSIFREIHTAHIHKEEAKPYNGVMVRSIKSLASIGAWGYGKGYVGTVKGAESFLWHDKYGMEAHIHSNLV